MPSVPPIIGRAAHVDRDALLALMTAQLEEHDIPVPALGAFIDRELTDDEHGQFLVARAEDGTLVGAAWMSWAFPLEIAAKVAWLEELYVVPAAREPAWAPRSFPR